MKMNDERGFLLFAAAVAVVLSLFSLSQPLFGETAAAAGIPTIISTFITLWGMYRLGRKLVSPTAGWLAAAALLASPLFLAVTMRPSQETAIVAAVVWSLYFYVKGKYLAASLLCALAVVFREQVIFLSAAFFIAEITESRLRRPGRLLLFASPVLVIVFMGAVNLITSGSFFSAAYFWRGEELSQGWFFPRLRFFATGLLSRDFRWLLTTAAVAGILKDRGRDVHSLPFALALLFPAIFYPPERLLFIAFLASGLLVYLIRERLYTTKLSVVFILFPLFIVVFHVLIVLLAEVSDTNPLSCTLAAYPFIILGGITVLYRYYSKGTATVIGMIYMAATAFSNGV